MGGTQAIAPCYFSPSYKPSRFPSQGADGFPLRSTGSQEWVGLPGLSHQSEEEPWDPMVQPPCGPYTVAQEVGMT